MESYIVQGKVRDEVMSDACRAMSLPGSHLPCQAGDRSSGELHLGPQADPWGKGKDQVRQVSRRSKGEDNQV